MTVTPGAGERELTILFTDVEGSTELRARLGDAAADDLLRLHEDIVRGEISRYGGDEVSFLGDGFMAAFPTTKRALRSALGIQRALEDHNRADPDRRIDVRIGFHHGEVSERDGTLVGQAVHGASRVAAKAAGGQIFVSSVVRDLCEGEPGITFRDRGQFWLKGFPDRWRLYEVEWRDVPVPEAPGGGRRTPFVKREGERADLRLALDRAASGRGGLVLVSGEAGVGKTRLTEEVAVEAEARKMRVLVGHCAEKEGSIPYLPFVEILEDALVGPRSPKELREAVGDAAGEIARIVPAVRMVIGDVPPPLELPPEQARRYLWLSLQEFVERAALLRPLMLVLEDLHWADESTVLLLEFLTPHLGEMPVLLVGTYRDDEVDVTDPLARAITQLGRRRLVSRIQLGRFGPDGVAEMIRGLSGQQPPNALVDAIHAESQGNAFFVEEVFLHLADSGRLFDPDGRFRTDLRIEELDVPESVRMLIGQRLERLSPEAQGVLLAAAVLGRVFAVELVERTADLERDAVADALDEAERARVIAPGQGGRLMFVHELIRQTLLTEASSVRRQRLHAKAAEAIEARYADDLDAHAADLAYHLSLCGSGTDPARLVHYLTVAGERAMRASAFSDAVSSFERALDHDVDRDTRADLLQRLAMALRSVGRWEDALRTMNDALDLYEAADRTEEFGRLAWAMVYQLAWAARFPEALTVSGRGLAALGELPNPDRARMASVTGWVLGLMGDYDGATPMFAEARALVTGLGDRRALADVLHMETIHHMGYGEFTKGIESGRRAADVFETEGALWDVVGVLTFVEFQEGTLLHLDEAKELAERVPALAERLGHLGALFMALADRIRWEGVMQGDLSYIDGLAPRLIEVCEQGGLPWLYVGHLYQGLVAAWRGDLEVAERKLRHAAEIEAPGAFSGQSISLLALFLADVGRTDEALALIDEWRGALPVPGQVNSLGKWNMLMAFTEALAVAGARSESAELYPLILEGLETIGDWVTFDCRLTSTRAGISAAAGRRFEEAERHFRTALELADRLPHRIEGADVRRLYASMLIERGASGDRERADELLGAAIEAYEDMGMPRLAATATAMLEVDVRQRRPVADHPDPA